MKRIIAIFLCLFFMISLAGCKKEESERSEYSLLKEYERSDSVPKFDFKSGETEITEEYMRFATGYMEFSFGLLSSAASEKENTVLSPLSAANVMALAANGADGTTLKEIRHTISGESIDLINGSLYYLNSRINAFNSDSSYFKTADSLWFDDSFDVKAAFLQNAVNFYDAEVMRISLDGSDTKGEINSWISDNTHSKIKDAVEALDSKALLVAASGAVLNDRWATPYTDAQVSEGVFHSADGDKTASFMNSREHYISTNYAKGFVKGFDSLPLKFAAIMPAEDMTITEFAENMTAARWQALLASQQATSFCEVSLPGFKVNTNTSLKENLKSMGIEKAFMDKADFSQLSNTGNPCISDVTQEAYIEIGPAGAREGGADASVVVDGSQKPESNIPQLNFDKPFIFVIYDNEAGIPVFMGIVNIAD